MASVEAVAVRQKQTTTPQASGGEAVEQEHHLG